MALVTEDIGRDFSSRVVEFQPLQVHSLRFSRSALRDDGMTGVAGIGDGLACLVDMGAIVAAKATRPNIMPDIVGPHSPVRFHFREEIVLKDPLGLDDRLPDLWLVLVIGVFFREFFSNHGDPRCLRNGPGSLDQGLGRIQFYGRNGRIDTTEPHGNIQSAVGRIENVGGTIVAVDAVEPPRGKSFLFGGQGRVFSLVDVHGAGL